MHENDIWGTAKKMRELYGARASETAFGRARRAYGNGDLVAYGRWKEISKIVGSYFGQKIVNDNLQD